MKKLDLAEDVFKYEAPQVEIIEVEVEKGFASSVGGEGSDMPIH